MPIISGAVGMSCASVWNKRSLRLALQERRGEREPHSCPAARHRANPSRYHTDSVWRYAAVAREHAWARYGAAPFVAEHKSERAAGPAPTASCLRAST